MRVFWDTNLFIYLIERSPQYFTAIQRLVHELSVLKAPIVTSTLTVGELLAHPLRLARHDLVLEYSRYFGSGAIELIVLDADVAQQYAHIRATTSLRQPDAIQVACALHAGCQTFYTNDRKLWGVQVAGLGQIRGLDSLDT